MHNEYDTVLVFLTKGKEENLINSSDAFVFHSPYCKLVQKSFARIFLNDFLQEPSPDFCVRYAGLESLR